MGQQARKRDRKSRNAKARRRGVRGLGTGVGAVLAFGMGPLAGSPAANADGLDAIIDPLINSIFGAAVDPFASLDAGSLDFGAADAAATSALSSADPALTAPWDPLAAQTSSDFGAVFNELAYQPLRTAEQEWITSSFGSHVDNEINSALGVFLIGNGANGVAGGTLAEATGGNGGMLFGDGGAGATDAAGQGGAGGDAGEYGDGGAGGAGADGGSMPSVFTAADF